MVVLLFLFLLVCFFASGPSLHAQISPDNWLSRERTSFVNGFFICLVFLSHTVVYDVPYGETESWLVARVIPGQLIVTSFFFFSGYGIMYSIRAKGQAYVRSILLSRFPKLLLMLDVAVVLTGGLHYCLGIRYNCEQ